jgi:hypothetical protein
LDGLGLQKREILAHLGQKWHNSLSGIDTQFVPFWSFFEAFPLSRPGSDLHAGAVYFQSLNEFDFRISIKQQHLFWAL